MSIDVSPSVKSPRIVVFGGGMTGLVAARELARQGFLVDVFEAQDHIGGLASTFFSDDGFVYDNGPRFIFSTLAEKIGIAHLCEPVRYHEHLHVEGHDYLFPFGLMKNPSFSLSAGLAMLTRWMHPTPETLGAFLRTYYGPGFSRRVLAPLIEKWAGVPVDGMSIDFASRLLPTSLSYILYQVLRKLRGGITEDYYKKGRYIVYPKGSNREIFTALAAQPGVTVHLQHRLRQFELEGSRIVAGHLDTPQGARRVPLDYAISTIPIHHLVDACGHPPGMQAWTKLKYRGIFILFIKVNLPKVLDGLWTWYPEARYPFYRISEFKNALPDLAPKDKTLLAVEFAASEDADWWNLSPKDIYARIQEDLRQLYGLKPESVIGFDLHTSPYAYPILKKDTEDLQRALTHDTPFDNLLIAGRIGNFQYRMLEGCYESATTCVARLTELMSRSSGDASHGTPRPSAPQEIPRDAYGRPLWVPE